MNRRSFFATLAALPIVRRLSPQSIPQSTANECVSTFGLNNAGEETLFGYPIRTSMLGPAIEMNSFTGMTIIDGQGNRTNLDDIRARLKVEES